ncbi:MAG TPA: class I SAM-dependent methyltransferase [bacterium]|nr:class I SAM-dependent methyltransferase [bacterium]
MENQEYFAMFSNENTHWWYRILHELTIFYLKKYLVNVDNPLILDAGCGTGRLLELLKKEKFKCEGIEYSDEALKYCKLRGLDGIIKADLNNVKLKEKYYDVIISNDVLYHKSIISDKIVIKKFKEALKPKGILILNLPAFEFLKSTHDTFIHTKKRYTKNAVNNMLINTGFKVEFISYRLFILFLPVMIYRIIKKIFCFKTTYNSDVQKMNNLLNKILFLIGKFENSLLKANIKFPFGVSVIAIAKNCNNE